MYRVRFNGSEYLLLANAHGLKSGSMPTREQYENGQCSFAHSYPDGTVKRFGVIIGSHDDIEIIERVGDVQPRPGALCEILSGSWAIEKLCDSLSRDEAQP